MKNVANKVRQRFKRSDSDSDSKKELSVNRRAEKLMEKKVASIKANGGKEIPSNLFEQCKKEIQDKDEQKASRKQAREQRRQEKRENPSTARKITSAVGNAGKTMLKGTGEFSKEAVSGLFEYAKDNKRKIAGKLAGATFGMATAGMMLGGSDFGDFSKAVAGYNVGSGFVEGFMSTSVEEIKRQAESSAQAIANLTKNKDIQSICAIAEQEGANKIDEKLKDAIDKIRNLLAGNKNKDFMLGEFAKTATDKDAGKKLTLDYISDLVNENDVDDDKKAAVMSAFAEYGALIQYKSLAGSINQAEGMNIDRETLGNIIGDRTANSSSINETIEENIVENIEEHRNSEINVNEIVSKVLGYLNGTSPSNLNLSDLKTQIGGLSTEQKTQVVNQINIEHKDITSIDEVINHINNTNSGE